MLDSRVAAGSSSTAARTTPYGAPVEPALQQTNAEVDLDFFPLLVTHTRQGFYADPIYGGNRDRVGWQVIGFPGPASLAEVHSGRYSTLDYFADNRRAPRTGGLTMTRSAASPSASTSASSAPVRPAPRPPRC